MSPGNSILLFALAFPAAALGATPLAQDAPATDAASAGAFVEVDEGIAAVLDDYDEAYEAYREAYRAAETDEGRRAVARPNPSDWFGRLWAIVELHPGAPAPARALLWIARNDRSGPDSGRAADVLLEHHLESPELVEACSLYVPNMQFGRAFLELVAQRSPERDVRASASFFLGKCRLQEAEYAEMLSAGEGGRGLRQYLGEDTAEALLEVDPAEARARAEELFEAVARDHRDVAHRSKGTLGAAADAELFEIRHLAVGKVAPDIAGDDLDGVAFKLSDYRGKVVLLDFWGNW
jgi:hypothetical protein